jgi:hypothetical protein
MRFNDRNPVLEVDEGLVHEPNRPLGMGYSNLFEYADSRAAEGRTRHEWGFGRDVNGPDSGSLWCVAA